MSDEQNDAAAKPTTSIFISYSRADTKFIDALATALESRGYAVRIDRSDIEKGEEWWKRIVDLIVDSSLVVFVLSPEAIASPVCRDEVGLTKRLGKRIVPLMWRDVRGLEIPDGLAERHWVSFEACDPSGKADDPALADRPAFSAALDQLEAAINLDDVLWAREHAHWLKRAMDWDRAGRPEGSVMRAGEITAAQTWANRRPQNSPAIPDLISDFLTASLAKEEQDREELNARERRISQELQRVIGLEVRRAREAHRYDSALRIALAGEPSKEELMRGLTSEPNRRAQLATAGHATRSVACLSGHSAAVRFAAFSPDGMRVVTASRDGTGRLWDAASGAELACLRHDDEVWGAAFSADGARVVTASGDKTAGVWDAASATQLARLPHDDLVMSATFSPDGAQLVTVSGKLVRVWDVASSAELTCLRHDDQVRSAAFSPDGERVVTNSTGKKARVWEVASGAELACFIHDGSVMSAAFSPDGARLVTASSDRTARLWHAASGTELARLPHGAAVYSAAFAPDGAR